MTTYTVTTGLAPRKRTLRTGLTLDAAKKLKELIEWDYRFALAYVEIVEDEAVPGPLSSADLVEAQ